MKKVVVLLICLILTGCTMTSRTTFTYSNNNEEKEVAKVESRAKNVKEFIKEKRDKHKSLKYYAVIHTGVETILLSEEVVQDTQNSIKANVYTHYKDKFYYIGQIVSSSSGEPILHVDDSLMYCTHHSYSKLTISKNEGLVEEVMDNTNDPQQKAHVKNYKLINNKKTQILLREVANQNVLKKNYYESHYNDKNLVVFNKI